MFMISMKTRTKPQSSRYIEFPPFSLKALQGARCGFSEFPQDSSFLLF